MLPSTDWNKPNTLVIVQNMPSLHREIHPSLFFGTSSILNSFLGYIKLGPGKSKSKSSAPTNFREVMTMPQDGGKIVIEWELPQPSLLDNNSITKSQILAGPIPTKTTIVVLLHGLNNNASFGYIRSAIRSCTNRGFVAAGVHMRGACPTLSHHVDITVPIPVTFDRLFIKFLRGYKTHLRPPLYSSLDTV
jgi:predicted alpha/beta-fold hydrolase